MAFWLLKTEPSTYSLADLERERRTVWDGVTNPLARRHLWAMRAGDGALLYHTGNERAVVGIATVASDPYPPPGGGPGEVVVDVAFARRLPRPVTLAQLRARPELADFELLRLPRLSVLPVPGPVWQLVLQLAEA